MAQEPALDSTEDARTQASGQNIWGWSQKSIGPTRGFHDPPSLSFDSGCLLLSVLHPATSSSHYSPAQILKSFIFPIELSSKTPNQSTNKTNQSQTPIPVPLGEVWCSLRQLSLHCHCDRVVRGRQAHGLFPCCGIPGGGHDEEVQIPRSECKCPG